MKTYGQLRTFCVHALFVIIFSLVTPLAGQPLLSENKAEWQVAGYLSTPVWDGKKLSFSSTAGSLTITPLSNDVIRVHFISPNSPTRHSFAVIDTTLGAVSPKVAINSSSTILATASLQVRIQHNPLRIEFLNTAGEMLNADQPNGGILMNGSEFHVLKQLPNDEHIYGLGEKVGPLDKRGHKYVMWNSDAFGYDSNTDPLYVSIPFYMGVRQGRAYGIFLDNPSLSAFDIGHTSQDLLTFGAATGGVDYYFINGPLPKQVLQRYTALTGRIPLPPRWSLGFHQCRYSYYPEPRVRLIADTFRTKNIPADAIWLDIHYQDNFKPFTWDRSRFPNPGKMVADLAAQGFRTVVIVDPHPKVEPGYFPYDSGLAGNHFVRNADGSLVEAPVWPIFGNNPGLSVFPDFTRSATRQWWGSLYKAFTDIGIAGIWNDMNEPTTFILSDSEPLSIAKTHPGTLPLNAIHNCPGGPCAHEEIHNAYGQLMSRSTFEGLAKLKPNERPFVLTRSTYAGGQRYAAVWMGDDKANWAALQQAVPMLLNMNLSGFPFVGSDVGGFLGNPSAELFTRWLQASIFFPFMRAHANLGTADREPWAFGSEYEEINRSAIELRYRLLPYIYNVMRQSSQNGVPAMRPLFFEFPGDQHVATIEYEYMFGSDLLVAPILWPEAILRIVNLPAGDWFDYWTGDHYTGGAALNVPVTIRSIPIFVRAGAFIFQQPVVQHTGQMSGNPLEILIAPASQSKSSLYEDDGTSMAYRAGEFMIRDFEQTYNKDEMTIKVSAPKGSYRPSARSLILETWSSNAPMSVSTQSNGTKITVPNRDINVLNEFSSGWSFSNGKLFIKTDDTFEAMRFTVKGQTLYQMKKLQKSNNR